MSSSKIKTSLIFTLLNANSRVFYGKYFIQNQCQNSLIFILLLFQLRFFVRHFLIQKIVAPEIYWFLWSKQCSIYQTYVSPKLFCYYISLLVISIEFKKNILILKCGHCLDWNASRVEALFSEKKFFCNCFVFIVAEIIFSFFAQCTMIKLLKKISVLHKIQYKSRKSVCPCYVFKLLLSIRLNIFVKKGILSCCKLWK